MDHYIPKRRVPVTLWSNAVQAVQGQLFLDLDAARKRHQTILERLNESGAFLPLSVGDEGRTCLFNKAALVRVTVGRQVIQSDVYARGFQPWREEDAEVQFHDGSSLSGKVWMPLQRATQRLSDFMNHQGAGFFVLTTATGLHLVNAAAVVRMTLSESNGAPLAGGSPDQDAIAG
jgi:hypothetical protein